MGYLFFSVEYPTEQTRASYLQSVSPNFRSTTFSLYQPLPASATIDDWKEMLTILQEFCSIEQKAKNTQSSQQLRPLKPNDDNYEAFQGPQWSRRAQMTPEIPPELAGFLGSSQNNKEPTPHYDHCANCTQKIPSSMLRCSRCKIVQYCSRDCQAKHWKGCHKTSCIPAEPNRTLFQALHTNDGFLVTSEECRELSRGFSACLKSNTTQHSTTKKSNMVEGFAVYFQYAADLGGCFVV
jgi:hypothetical protein